MGAECDQELLAGDPLIPHRDGVGTEKPDIAFEDVDRVRAIGQGEPALAWLDEAVKRSVVVNHPQAIRGCYRVNLVDRLARGGVPQPRWAIAAERFPDELGDGPWLKRGDVHAMEAGDVRRVFAEAEWTWIAADFQRRGIGRAIVPAR